MHSIDNHVKLKFGPSQSEENDEEDKDEKFG